MNSIDNKKDYRQGLISVLGSSIWWGIMPIYWQWLKPIDSIVIIFYRIVLVALVCLIAALIAHKKEEILAPLKDKKLMAKLIIAGVIITLNWSLYIYAVNSENVIQSCIGYYIEPLVVCLFGMIFFGEKVNKHKAIALIMGAIGVVAVVFYFRQVPALALSIAFSFAIYAAIKKGLGMPPIISLLYETIFLAPFSAGDSDLYRDTRDRSPGGRHGRKVLPSHVLRTVHGLSSGALCERGKQDQHVHSGTYGVHFSYHIFVPQYILLQRGILPGAAYRLCGDLDRTGILHHRGVQGVQKCRK